MCTHAHTPTSCLPQTRDLKFDEMKQRVLSLEALLRTMVKDIQSWQDEMQVCVLQYSPQYSSVYLSELAWILLFL